MIPVHVRVAALEKTLAAFEGRPFGWGSADCVLFVAALAVNAGLPDPVEGLSWSSASSATREALNEAETLSAAIDARFGRISPAETLPGDLLGFQAEAAVPVFDVAIGVFDGSTGLCWLEAGLIRAPRERALMAWRLG